MGSSTQTPVHQTWFMLGELIRLRQGDEETSRERYYYEHQESMAARQRSELLQQEFEAASQTLRAELTLQAEQYMNHYAQEEQAYFHSTARAMEMHAEALMAQERAQLMHHYLVQTTEVEQRARAAETVFNQLHQEHLEQFQEVNAQHEETQQLLRRELEESQQEGEANAEESQRIRQILQRERAMQEQNLVRQAEGWRQHSASVAEVAQRTIAEREDDLTIERLNADELRTELQEAQADLTQWQEWYDQYDWPEEEEGDLYDAEGTAEEEAAAAAASPRAARSSRSCSKHSGGTTSNSAGVVGANPSTSDASFNSTYLWYSSTRAIGKTYFQCDESSAAAAVNPDSSRDFFAHWSVFA